MRYGFKFLVLLVVLSAAFLHRNIDLPEFGDMHDDSIYYVSAKSLASGSYRIESLPMQPYQTKYPPLYPLLLSIAWRLNPHFPDNLPLAAWISWLALPLLLALLMMLYPKMGIDDWRKWLILSALALNPYIILCSSTLLSELWFTALLAGALLLVERAAEPDSPTSWAVAAGFVGGLAYLTRSAGIVLLASGVLYLWIRRRRTEAIVFGTVMFPFVAGWMLWARLHELRTDDASLVYYTDYFRYEAFNVSVRTLHLFLWKNLDGLLSGLGYIIVPNLTSLMFMKILAEIIGVAMISGIVRMVRRGAAHAGLTAHYAMFAGGSACMLLIWHFPPNERFVLPLVPLAFAGLLTEMEHFVGMAGAGMRHRAPSQRAAAAIMLAGATVVCLGAVAMQAYVVGVFLDESQNGQRVRNMDRHAAYAWIRANLPSDAILVAYNDPLLYLYTGHHSIGRPLPPYIWYTEDHARSVEMYRDLASYAREHGATYFYHTTADLRRDTADSDIASIEDTIRSNSALTLIYRHGIGAIYQVEAHELERPEIAPHYRVPN